GNSQLYRNFHLLPQLHRNKHLKNTQLFGEKKIREILGGLAIVLSYKSLSLDPPEKLHAHSTRGVSSSWALLKGVSVEDICKAASWNSRHTFIRFYMLDVAEPSFLHSVL